MRIRATPRCQLAREDDQGGDAGVEDAIDVAEIDQALGNTIIDGLADAEQAKPASQVERPADIDAQAPRIDAVVELGGVADEA